MCYSRMYCMCVVLTLSSSENIVLVCDKCDGFQSDTSKRILLIKKKRKKNVLHSYFYLEKQKKRPNETREAILSPPQRMVPLFLLNPLSLKRKSKVCFVG